MKIIFSLGLVVTTAISFNSLFAQNTSFPNSSPQQRRSFVITEFGYFYKVNSPLRRSFISTENDSTTFDNETDVTGRHYLVSELGFMHNLSTKYGLGVTHFMGWDVGQALCGGFTFRVRRWLNRGKSLDLSAGALLWTGNSMDLDTPAFVASAGINFSDWGSVNLMIELLQAKPLYDEWRDIDGVTHRHIGPRRRDTAVHLGFKFGSKPGYVLNIAAYGSIVALLVYGLSVDKSD